LAVSPGSGKRVYLRKTHHNKYKANSYYYILILYIPSCFINFENVKFVNFIIRIVHPTREHYDNSNPTATFSVVARFGMKLYHKIISFDDTVDSEAI
jgi:hypothetical protein